VLAARAAHAVHSALDVAELAAALGPPLEKGGRGWAVLFAQPAGDRFAVFLRGPDAATRVDPSAWGPLEELLAGDGAIRPVDGPPLAPGGPRVSAAAALALRGETYGLLVRLGAPDPDPSVWQPVADALATELVKLQLQEAAARDASRASVKLAALNEAGELVKYVDLDALLPRLMELSIRIMRAQVGAIVLRRDDRLTTGVEWGLTEEFLLALRTPGGAPFLEELIERGEAVLIPDAAASDRVETRGLERRLAGLLVIPLVTQAKRQGAIVIVNPGENDLDEGDFDVLSTIANLAASVVESALLYQQAAALHRVEAEMQLAARVQTALLPRRAPVRRGVELAGWNMPCSETGGDYFDFIDLGEGRTAVVIADATGHGMGAALMMFIVRSTLRALLTGRRDLAALLETMNDLIEEASADDRFMTLFLGVIDAAGETITYASAGHDPPLIWSAERETVEEPELRAGSPLGVLPGSRYAVHERALRPGDVWVLGTDGIWEARDPHGRFYGKERLAGLIREGARLPLGQLSDSIREDVLAFHAGAPHVDDITAVFLRAI
jgi:serine phosphatase RsbU (regulator of sigma subunit)